MRLIASIVGTFSLGFLASVAASSCAEEDGCQPLSAFPVPTHTGTYGVGQVLSYTEEGDSAQLPFVINEGQVKITSKRVVITYVSDGVEHEATYDVVPNE